VVAKQSKKYTHVNTVNYNKQKSQKKTKKQWASVHGTM